MVSEAESSLEQEIAALVRASSSSPLPVVQLHVGDSPTGVVITGRVLTQGQARAVRRLGAAHAAGVDIEILAEPALGLEEGWLEITGREPVEVWREPALMWRDYARQTEYLAADGPLRRLGRVDAAQLVQGPDLSLGWVGERDLTQADSEASRRNWERLRRWQDGEVVLPDPPPLPPGAAAAGSARAGAELTARLIDAARSHLGVPYRWGGTTDRGFDCSGLVQRLFSTATGVLLPKHTGDQRHAGVRVVPAEARAGDLLFATTRGRRIGHVMLLTSADTVLHACRTEMKVIEEPLVANAERYQHQGFRRPVQLGS